MNDRDSDPETQPRGVLPSKRRYDEGESERLDPEDVLERIETLDVREWKYAARAESGAESRAEHVGPAAEDFYETFGVGEDADSIAAGDADGVALAAIQGLSERLEEQRERIERQDRRIEEQRETITEQRDDLESLRATVESIVTGIVGLRREVRETRER